MENNEIDATEKTKREARLKRFGAIDTEYLGSLTPNKRTKAKKRLTPLDLHPINPKETYKLMLPETPVFDKKRIMMFGVNLMSTIDIEAYFNRYDYKVKKIFWLNDFCCIVQFDTEEKAMEAYWKMTQQTYDGNKSDKDNYDWKPAEKETLFEVEMDIELRIAEVEDVNRKSKKNESVYYRFYNRNSINTNGYGGIYYNDKTEENKKKRLERSREKDEEVK